VAGTSQHRSTLWFRAEAGSSRAAAAAFRARSGVEIMPRATPALWEDSVAKLGGHYVRVPGQETPAVSRPARPEASSTEPGEADLPQQC